MMPQNTDKTCPFTDTRVAVAVCSRCGAKFPAGGGGEVIYPSTGKVVALCNRCAKGGQERDNRRE